MYKSSRLWFLIADEKEDGTRKSEYGRYGRVKSGRSENMKGFEHVIRYDDGIKADFVLASCSVPVSFDYTRLPKQQRHQKGIHEIIMTRCFFV